jgi:chromosome segregation ATPase
LQEELQQKDSILRRHEQDVRSIPFLKTDPDKAKQDLELMTIEEEATIPQCQAIAEKLEDMQLHIESLEVIITDNKAQLSIKDLLLRQHEEDLRSIPVLKSDLDKARQDLELRTIDDEKFKSEYQETIKKMAQMRVEIESLKAEITYNREELTWKDVLLSQKEEDLRSIPKLKADLYEAKRNLDLMTTENEKPTPQRQATVEKLEQMQLQIQPLGVNITDEAELSIEDLIQRWKEEDSRVIPQLKADLNKTAQNLKLIAIENDKNKAECEAIAKKMKDVESKIDPLKDL